MAATNERDAVEDQLAKFKREVDEGRFAYFYADEAATRIGYANYDSYLCSDIWQIIHQRVFERENNRCQGCNRDANVVHHRRYTEAILRGKDDSQLFSLCHNCHDYVEFGSKSYLIMGPRSIPRRIGVSTN